MDRSGGAERAAMGCSRSQPLCELGGGGAQGWGGERPVPVRRKTETQAFLRKDLGHLVHQLMASLGHGTCTRRQSDVARMSSP